MGVRRASQGGIGGHSPFSPHVYVCRRVYMESDASVCDTKLSKPFFKTDPPSTLSNIQLHVACAARGKSRLRIPQVEGSFCLLRHRTPSCQVKVPPSRPLTRVDTSKPFISPSPPTLPAPESRAGTWAEVVLPWGYR